MAAANTGGACGALVSNKCCWWRARLHNLSRSGGGMPTVLTQEPANSVKWLDAEWNVQHAIDPGFDGATDFCPSDDIAGFLTVLRHPVARVHSHSA